MRPNDSGVIGLHHPIAPVDADAALSGSPMGFAGALPALALGDLPDGVADFEPPAFALSRKEFEQDGTPLSGGLPYSPGGSGGDTHAASVLDGAISPALDSAHSALSGAQQALSNAQGVLGNAQAALNNVPAALNAAQAAFDQAAGSPVLPPLPADPVGDLMKGLSVPAIPGIDALFKPFLDLINSFGTGVLGNLNPATLLSQGSKVIESAVQVGTGALKTVESVWKGQASDKAQSAGQQARTHGQETTQRGFDLSTLTEQAAAVVQRGNIQLTAIAQSFAAQATTLAPVALTPPGQTALIASATEHLGSAITVVNLTHGELSGYTTQLNTVIAQLLGQNGTGPNPAEVAQSLAQNVGQPILEQAKSLLEGATNPAANPGGKPKPNSPTDLDTKAAGLGGGGAGGGSGGGGIGGGGLGGIPSTPGGPGSSIPGGRIAAQANPFGSGTAGIPGIGSPGNPGFMGSPAAAGAGQRGGSDADHGRNVQPHQSLTAESELTGNLGAASPEVIDRPGREDALGDYQNPDETTPPTTTSLQGPITD